MKIYQLFESLKQLFTDNFTCLAESLASKQKWNNKTILQILVSYVVSVNGKFV